MKREYVRPQSNYVDISLNESFLEEPIIPISDTPSNKGVWEEEDGQLPSAKSVWDEEDIKEE